jgi:hypothetical protein
MSVLAGTNLRHERHLDLDAVYGMNARPSCRFFDVT